MAEQIVMMSLSVLKPHPRNTEFFDDADEVSFKNLKASIEDLGVLTPLRVTSDMTIISGHQRYRACQELGISKVPTLITDDEMSEDDVLQQLIASNFGRIKNDPVKQGNLILEYEKLAKITHGGNRRSSGNNCHLITQEDIAKQLGVSTRTLRNLKTLTTLPPELQELITTGKVTTTAGLNILSKLSPEEQRTLLLSLPETERVSTAQLQALAARAQGAESKLESVEAKYKAMQLQASKAQAALQQAQREAPTSFQGQEEMAEQIAKLQASHVAQLKKIAEYDAQLRAAHKPTEVLVEPPDYQSLKAQAASATVLREELERLRERVVTPAPPTGEQGKVHATISDNEGMSLGGPSTTVSAESDMLKTLIGKMHRFLNTQVLPIYTEKSQYTGLTEEVIASVSGQCSDIVAIIGRIQKNLRTKEG